jgi:hypothetical protein
MPLVSIPILGCWPRISAAFVANGIIKKKRRMNFNISVIVCRVQRYLLVLACSKMSIKITVSDTTLGAFNRSDAIY